MEPFKKQRPDIPEIKKSETGTQKPPDEKNEPSKPKSFLSVLNSLQAQFEQDEIPDLTRITRQQFGPRKEKNPEFKRLLDKKETKKPEKDIQTAGELSDQASEKNLQSRGRKKRDFSVAWDNLESYMRAHSEARHKKIVEKDEKKSGIEIPFKLLDKFMKMFLKTDILGYFNSRSLLKMFLFANLMLLIQLKVSKQARKWFLFTVNAFVYITGLSLSAGTLVLLALKFRKRLSKSSEEIAPTQIQSQIQNKPAEQTAIPQSTLQ